MAWPGGTVRPCPKVSAGPGADRRLHSKETLVRGYNRVLEPPAPGRKHWRIKSAGAVLTGVHVSGQYAFLSFLRYTSIFFQNN